MRLGDRLAVGHETLDLAAEVRILLPQPIFSVPTIILINSQQENLLTPPLVTHRYRPPV